MKGRSMDTNAQLANVAVAAIVGAVTAIAIHQVQKVTNAKATKAELEAAEREGHLRGWYEGRESIVQQMIPADMNPQDFNTVR